MRLVQFHDKAVEPPGDARSEAWFIYHLGHRLKELYAGSSEPRDQGFLALTWDYATDGPRPATRDRRRSWRRSTAGRWPTASR